VFKLWIFIICGSKKCFKIITKNYMRSCFFLEKMSSKSEKNCNTYFFLIKCCHNINTLPVHMIYIYFTWFAYDHIHIIRLLTIFQCNDLCHTLFKVTTHHHNRLYLVQIFPEDKRGSYIQRRLSYLFLQDMFDVGRDTDIQYFKVILTILKIEIIWNFIWVFFFQLQNRYHY
jgi:hypothetical protein